MIITKEKQLIIEEKLMENAQIKKEMLDLFKSLRSELVGIVDNLNETQKQECGSLQKWGAKDMLVHLSFWGDHFNRQVEAARAGKPVPEAGDYYEIINDGILLRNKGKTFEKARQEEGTVFAKSIALLETENPDDLVDPQKYAHMNGHSLLDRALGTECYHVAAHISDYYLKEGFYDKAARLQEEYTEKLLVFPTWNANAYYNLACFYSLNGKKDKALSNLELAFKEKPDLKEWSKKDTDIDPLRNEKIYQALIK
jgi:tetratricopeptide (TPR) repeat protein